MPCFAIRRPSIMLRRLHATEIQGLAVLNVCHGKYIPDFYGSEIDHKGVHFVGCVVAAQVLSAQASDAITFFQLMRGFELDTFQPFASIQDEIVSCVIAMWF